MTTPVLEVLEEEECLRLLATQVVGRLAVVRGGYPVVLPVNYALHRDRIVVHTDSGGKFWAARRHRVAFEVDRIKERDRTAWSVLAQGFAVDISPDDPRFQEIAGPPVEPWAPGERDHLLVVTPISVTGRRIRRL